MPSSGPIKYQLPFQLCFPLPSLKRLVGGRKIKIAREVLCKVGKKSTDRNDVRVGVDLS